MQRWAPATIAAVAVVLLLFGATKLRPEAPGRHPPVEGLELADPASVPDPSETEKAPGGYRRVVARDAIAPVYDPRFVRADETDWQDTSDVIGVEIDGEAKAYPVAFLNHREMVIDRLHGVPILVSW